MSAKFIALAIFSALTLVNIILYTYHISSRFGKSDGFSCSFNNILEAFSEYIQKNGRIPLAETLPEMCKELTPSKENVGLFREVLKEVVYQCSLKPPVSIDMEIRKPIVTLFTSLKSTPEKYFVHNTTIRNWSSFLPKVNLVAFTNDSRVKYECEARGWTVFPIIHHAAGGVPVLKTMFKTVMEKFDTPFYGFSNADILYTDTLLKTLIQATRFFGDKRVMITGRRYNIPMLTLREAVSYDTIKSTVKKRGELFTDASEDFFITSKQFKWDGVPDLVIGRPAYDNWLVSHARCTGSNVVDGTSTVMAAHQTTKSGNMEGWSTKFKNYNVDLLKSKKLKLRFDQGFTSCPEYHAITNLCGTTEILKRNGLPKYCKC